MSTAVLRPQGVLGPVEAMGLRETFTRVLASGDSGVIVDLTGVQDLSAAGLAAVTHLLNQGRRSGIQVRVLPPEEGSEAARIIEQADLRRFLAPGGLWNVQENEHHHRESDDRQERLLARSLGHRVAQRLRQCIPVRPNRFAGNAVGVFVLAGFAAGAVSMTLGAGSAAADNPHDKFDGKTYGKAIAAVSNYYNPVVASKVGDQVPTEDCIVMSSTLTHYTDSRGRKRGRDYLFHLNCQAGVASGKPGNSATSAIGLKTKEDQDSARTLQTRLDKDPDTCNKSENSYDWCVRLCDRTKLCEVPKFSAT